MASTTGTSDPTGLVTHSDRLSARAAELAYSEMARLLDRTTGSKALYERAVEHLPLGVPSSFQAGDPYPIYVDRGHGSHVWDVDGNEYLDFHGGFGVGIAGHAHPEIVDAITYAVNHGTHFAAPTPTTVELAEEICRRFELDKVRFANSGTEATMDAIRVARAATGRDVIVKIEGSYHGHHDAVMFSVLPNAEAVGSRDMSSTTPMSAGIPADTANYTLVVPFNDADAFERAITGSAALRATRLRPSPPG